MKAIFYMLLAILSLHFIQCKSSNAPILDANSKENNRTSSDTIRIANDSIGYEIVILDPGFNSWFYMNAKPRNYYSQNYLEMRNQDWVRGWNMGIIGNRRDLFMISIDYDSKINYGYEVNYMLFNYLVYFQNTNHVKLGSFPARP